MNGVVGEEDDTLVLHTLVNIILNYKSKIILRTRDPKLILDMYLPPLSNPSQEKQRLRFALPISNKSYDQIELLPGLVSILSHES